MAVTLIDPDVSFVILKVFAALSANRHRSESKARRGRGHRRRPGARKNNERQQIAGVITDGCRARISPMIAGAR